MFQLISSLSNLSSQCLCYNKERAFMPFHVELGFLLCEEKEENRRGSSSVIRHLLKPHLKWLYIPWNVWIVYFPTLWFFNLDEEGGVINAQRLCFYVKTKSVLRFDNLLSYNKKGYLCNNRKWSNFPIQFDKLFALAIMLTQTSQFVPNSVTYVRRQNALSLYYLHYAG